MRRPWEPVKVKVLLGYLFLVCIASFTVWVIYSQVLRFSEDRKGISRQNDNIMFINSVLTNLYQAELLERNYMQTGNRAQFRNYEQLMDEIYLQFDTLSRLSGNPLHQINTDSMRSLLDKKRENLKELVAIKQMGSSEDLYDRAMTRLTYSRDSINYFLNVYKTVTNSHESVYVQQKKKKFFERLIYAFSPKENQDSSLRTSVRQSVQIDSILNDFNPADSVTQFLTSIMQDVRRESIKIERQLAQKEREVLANDRTITLQLRQMLSLFENESFASSFNELREMQNRLKTTTRLIPLLGILALAIIILFLVLILKDISRSQHYRRELEQAKAYSESLLRSKEQLMLSITHDIKSPLASVIGYARLMNNVLTKEQKDYYLENINNAADHILKLINDLVDLIKLETGKLKIEYVNFNLRTLVQEISAGFYPIALAKDLLFRLEYKVPPSNDYYCDAVRLKQILGNLISNAIKFTDKGEVVMRVSLVNSADTIDKISFNVSDTGIGISENDSKFIFNEFSQAAHSDQRKYEGAGLGLAITKRLTLLLKGTITFTSKPGAGSQFSVVLPMERSNPGISVTETIIPALTLTNEIAHILLIDDDITYLNLTAEILESAQMKVFKCSHPTQALQVLKQHTVDLIITDIQMPAITGVDLLAFIQRKTGRYLPVIAITGQDSTAIADYAEIGFAACLTKPYLPEQLFDSINKVLSQKKSHVSLKNKVINNDYIIRDNSGTNSYNLEQIRKFADNDPQSLYQILVSFVQSTHENLTLFRNYLDDKNYQLLPELAHKMISMFRQLEAFQIVTPLQKIEGNRNKQLTNEEWNTLGNEALNNIEHFVGDFCKDQHITLK